MGLLLLAVLTKAPKILLPRDEDERAASLIKPPRRIKELVGCYMEDLKKNSTRAKTLAELNPLIWNSFCVTLNLTDPKTMLEMVTWDPGSFDFVRPLDRDFFLWDGVKIYFMNLNLVNDFFKAPSKKLCCPTCKHTLGSNGWSSQCRRVCSSDGKPTFLHYCQYTCAACRPQGAPLNFFFAQTF